MPSKTARGGVAYSFFAACYWGGERWYLSSLLGSIHVYKQSIQNHAKWLMCYCLKPGGNNTANDTQRTVDSCENQSHRCCIIGKKQKTSVARRTCYCTSPCWIWGNAEQQGFFALGSTDGCCHQLMHSQAPPLGRTRIMKRHVSHKIRIAI